VLRLVDCNVTHDVTLFCVGSPIYTKYKTLARQKQKKQPDAWSLSSPQTMGKANGILREQVTQPVGNLTHVTQQIRVAQLLSWSPTLNQK
jgi:hypothetical protein